MPNQDPLKQSATPPAALLNLLRQIPRTLAAALLLGLLTGCVSNFAQPNDRDAAEDHEAHEEHDENEAMEMGPPPPEYWRILAEAVPNWKPEDMHPVTEGLPMWTAIGPRPMSNEYWSGNTSAGGRTVGIAVDPTDARTVYIATASGGIWKSTNAGSTWVPLTDELSILTHGAIAIDPSNHNTIYAGTGEYTQGSGGDGLFRSTDGGLTWARIATATQVGSTCSRIAVDPTDPLVIHVTGSNGYVRSTDGGATWSTRLAGGSCSDLALNPVNPQTVFIARQGQGIYRSTNGGTTLARLAGGLPTFGLSRILLAMAPSSPDTIYATIINNSASLLGAYKTIDGGTTWTLLPATPNFPSPQGWYSCCMAVSPTNPDICYAGGVFPSYAVAGVIKTSNGGLSWTDITVSGGTQLHPDQQALAFGPDGTLWVGNDGGIAKSTNAGASWINCNATLAATQHYQIAIHPTDTGRLLGGTQDNGTAARSPGSDVWAQIVAGDGGFCCYDRANPSRRYASFVYLTVYRQSGGTTNITGAWATTPADPVNFIAPLVMDPNVSTTLLAGTNRVWRTINATAPTPTWTAISTSAVSAFNGTLNTIAVAAGASNTIYTGSSNGRVFVTTNATVWNDRSVGLPAGEISDIIISPTAPGTAFVAVSTGSGNGRRVLRTDNFGVTWADNTGTLPAGARAKALEIDWRFTPPVMYVGTGAGIYWSFDAGANWTKDGADFPNVSVGDIQIDRTNNLITVGTYGRGVWRATLLIPPGSCYPNCRGCSAADIAGGGPDGLSFDGVVDGTDFVAFFNAFAVGDATLDPRADIAGGGPDGLSPDGIVDGTDLITFMNAFVAGC